MFRKPIDGRDTSSDGFIIINRLPQEKQKTNKEGELHWTLH